jgi:SAM-dependent MidA family methyltransferase
VTAAPSPLEARLRARIAKEGPLPFRDFMDAALHDPEHGYYGAGRDIGARGDFYTASNVSLFPTALRRFVEGALGRLEGARIVELGGGTGALAATLGVRLTVVEPNVGMAAAQRARGLDVAPSLDALDPAPTVFLANEVLDALPVHRLLGTPEGVREGHVDWRDGRFVEVAGPLSRPELADEARRLAPQLAPGCAAEVNLEARALLRAMARAAPRAVALFLDYGGEAHELYGPDHARGTLRGYREHRVVHPLEAPGLQDVTADVDFPAVEGLARAEGFDVLGRRPQGQFLADLGLLDDMQAALGRGDLEAYAAAKNLLFPGGMGARFKALVLGRGVVAEPPLPGLRPDLMPGLGWR